MTIVTVQLRIIAENEAAARGAIEALRASLGTARVALQPPWPGRDKHGTGRPEWLAYGTFQFDDGADTPVQLPTPSPPPASAPPRLARAARATTGATEVLAATGPTRRLPRRKRSP